MKIVILDGHTANPGDLSWGELESLGTVSVYDWTDPEDVVSRLKGADAAFTNKVPINAEQMAELPVLKYIGIMATGMDAIDIKAAHERGIVVTNVPQYANYSVAQLTFALIMELCYGIDKHSKSIKEDKLWSRQEYNSYWLQPLIGLHGKILGIIGMGKIGEQVSTIGKAFGMDILAYDVYPRDMQGVTWTGMEDLLRQSDIVSVHCPLTPSTKGIINKDMLKLMRPNAFFINTSRGQLMIEEDLADALNRGVIAGAGLDVLAHEPPLPDNPLLNARNVIITPHIGWATVEARKKLISEAALNYKAFVNKGKRNVV